MFTIVRWNSPDYWHGIRLRNQLLKETAGRDIIKEAPIEEKDWIHLTARINGTVAGTLILHPITDQIVQIKQVAIDPSFQGCGLGRQLIIYAEMVATKLGYQVVFLTGRESAWGFYHRLAYESMNHIYCEGQTCFNVFRKKLQSNHMNYFSKEMKTNG